MEEITKEQRLALITSWKGILEDQKYDLEAGQLELQALASRATVLEAKERLIKARMSLAYSALSSLGVRL